MNKPGSGKSDESAIHHSSFTTHNTLVPRLRFPEFRDTGEWDIAPLKKLANRRTDRNRDGKLTRVLTNSAEHGVVDQRDYFDKDIATQGNLENYFIVEKNDFVYNPRISAFAPVGPISRNRIETGVMSPLYTVFQFKDANTSFQAHYFKSSAWHTYMRQVGSTGARHDRMAVSNEDFMAMPLPVPSADEQQKIADCLSSIDMLIAAQADKIDALKTHKKGLMQQLFPREGETVPRLRFPEFRDAGEWEEKTLRSICERIMDGTHFSPKSKSGPRPYLTSKNIREGRLDLSSLSYISEDDHREIYARCPVKKFDVLLTKDGANTGNCTINMLEEEFSLLSSVAVLRGKALLILQEFLYQSIVSERMQTTIVSSMSGQAITRITLEKLGNYAIPLPSISEQERIADCLSSIDALIAAQSGKIDTLKIHKKGLMQQLFPSMEATK